MSRISLSRLKFSCVGVPVFDFSRQYTLHLSTYLIYLDLTSLYLCLSLSSLSLTVFFSQSLLITYLSYCIFLLYLSLIFEQMCHGPRSPSRSSCKAWTDDFWFEPMIQEVPGVSSQQELYDKWAVSIGSLSQNFTDQWTQLQALQLFASLMKLSFRCSKIGSRFELPSLKNHANLQCLNEIYFPMWLLCSHTHTHIHCNYALTLTGAHGLAMLSDTKLVSWARCKLNQVDKPGSSRSSGSQATVCEVCEGEYLSHFKAWGVSHG